MGDAGAGGLKGAAPPLLKGAAPPLLVARSRSYAANRGFFIPCDVALQIVMMNANAD